MRRCSRCRKSALAIAPDSNAARNSSSFTRPPSDPLEVPEQFPVGHGLIERLLLQSCRVQIVIDHAVAERRPRNLRALQLADGFAERLGYLGQRGVLVGVALVEPWRLELAGDAVQAGGD